MSTKSNGANDVITPPTTAPPTVYTDTSSVVVTEGDNVHLICNTRGTPPPRRTWTNDLKITPTLLQDVLESGVLSFTSVTLSQQARYWCIGTNFLVNPPQGKRYAYDMTHIDLIVKREWQHLCVTLLWYDGFSPLHPTSTTDTSM